MTSQRSQPGRVVEAEIEIAAPAEAVWKALTEAAEISRWFAPDVKVTPGKGGAIAMSWGGDYAGEARIEVWEPNRRLGTVMEMPPMAAEQAGGGQAIRIAIDYYLESKGGTTVLRLVHAGFGSGADWDEEYEGVRHGWAMELRGLRLYLERHRGEDRSIVWLRTPVELPNEQVWPALVGEKGLLPFPAAAAREGDRVRLRAATGDVFDGTVSTFMPPRSFGVVVANLNDGIFRMFLERYQGSNLLNTWFSGWGVPRQELDGLRERWTRTLNQRFAQPTAEKVLGKTA